jgi:hypothetical protein
MNTKNKQISIYQLNIDTKLSYLHLFFLFYDSPFYILNFPLIKLIMSIYYHADKTEIRQLRR